MTIDQTENFEQQMSDPRIQALTEQAVKEKWSEEKFVEEVEKLRK